MLPDGRPILPASLGETTGFRAPPSHPFSGHKNCLVPQTQYYVPNLQIPIKDVTSRCATSLHVNSKGGKEDLLP